MKARIRNRILLGAGSLAALGAAALVLRGTQPAKPAMTTPTDTAAVTPNAAAPAEELIARDPGCAFAPGEKLAYAIETTVKTKIDTAKTNLDPSINDSAALTRTSRATLVMRALSSDARTGSVVLARLHDVDRLTTAAAGDMTPPFLARIDRACKIVGYARLASTPIPAARATQAMFHELQFSWAKNGETQGRGENGYGSYAATFTASRGPVIVRHIDTYTRAWEDAWSRGIDVDDPVQATEHKPIASELTVRAGRGPWFESLENNERMEGMLSSELVSHTAAHRVEARNELLDGQPTGDASYVWENLLPRKVKTLETVSMSAREQKKLAELKSVTVSEAMDKFLGRVAAKENISTQWPELSQYMRARPEMTEEIAKRLRSGELPEDSTAAVFIALGQTPTPEAKTALLAINGDKSAHTIDRSRAAFALVGRSDVGIELARTLHDDARLVANGPNRMARLYAREAALALGMMAGLKGEEEPAIMNEGRGAVTELLREGRDAITWRPAFKVVANMGDPSMLSVVQPYMSHADPRVRKGAAIAFRRMSPARTAPMTAAWLARESDPDVKRALYNVVHLQLHDAEATPDNEIVARAIADLDARPAVLTRQSLVRILGRASATMPEAKAALLRNVHAELEAKEGVEELMRKYLTAAEMSAAKGAP